LRVRGGTSTAEKRSCRTTSRDGTSSTEGRRGTDVTLAEHAGKVDRDLGLLLSRFAGLVSRIRRELPIRRDPAATRNAYGEQQLELDVWMNDLFVDACRESNLVAEVASEEMGEVKDLGRGRFSVVLDPLDGSSNVRSNNIFGTAVRSWETSIRFSITAASSGIRRRLTSEKENTVSTSSRTRSRSSRRRRAEPGRPGPNASSTCPRPASTRPSPRTSGIGT